VNYDIKVKTKNEIDKDTLFNKNLVMFIFFLSITAFAQRMIGIFIPLYLVDIRGLNENLSSLIYGSGAMMGMIGAPCGGFLASKYGEKKWLFRVLFLASLSFSLAIIVPYARIFIILYIFYVFCNTLVMSARSALMASLIPSKKRGLGYSLYFLPGSLMSVIAPIFASNFANFYNLTNTFFLALGISFLGLFILIKGVELPSQNNQNES
jgi:MFS family permease